MKSSLSKKIDNHILLLVNKNRCASCNSFYSKTNCLFVVYHGENFNTVTRQNIYNPTTKIPIYFDDIKLKVLKNIISELTFSISLICRKCGKIRAVKYPITKINSCG